ncbi:hypothetical protein BgiMline_006391, partial [Biomphalaria glabrata]
NSHPGRWRNTTDCDCNHLSLYYSPLPFSLLLGLKKNSKFIPGSVPTNQISGCSSDEWPVSE